MYVNHADYKFELNCYRHRWIYLEEITGCGTEHL